MPVSGKQGVCSMFLLMGEKYEHGLFYRLSNKPSKNK